LTPGRKQFKLGFIRVSEQEALGMLLRWSRVLTPCWPTDGRSHLPVCTTEYQRRECTWQQEGLAVSPSGVRRSGGDLRTADSGVQFLPDWDSSSRFVGFPAADNPGSALRTVLNTYRKQRSLDLASVFLSMNG